MRNTPTRVGKTFFLLGWGFWFWKHPHAGGEDRKTRLPRRSLTETPPRGWGRRFLRSLPAQVRGNTPTRVGKTPGRKRRTGRWWKHPHAGGEDQGLGTLSLRQTETPPRGWGRQKQLSHVSRGRRNTPTRVGKTIAKQEDENVGEKHPHAGGEDHVYGKTLDLLRETPPRGWGRPLRPFPSVRGTGNTPTRVGKTPAAGFRAAAKRKHPHAGGEDKKPHPHPESCAETPPRGWGRLYVFSELRRFWRNTPTRVGKTSTIW